MKRRSDGASDQAQLRERIIGLGEHSVRKSYYPELRARLDELERFRALLDQTNDAILLLEVPGGVIADLSQTFSRMVGVTREGLLGKLLGPFAPAIAERVGAQQAGRVVTELSGPEGRVQVEAAISFVTFGEHRFAVVVARDIGERLRAERAQLEAEQRFRATFEGAAIGMGMVGLDGRLQDTNAGLQAMLGRSAEELHGSSLL
ncbi:MAG: PAS domain S-box protein [Deltaproteobacteria bacterium]|nr:PAS domain S-box protein [Deltaproteobacteria bacterium]